MKWWRNWRSTQTAGFLAIRFDVAANLGAYLSSVGTMIPTRNILVNAIGQYRTPLIEVSTRCYFTNTTPIGAYRGAGRPEANYFMERLIEMAAREMGLDAVELRRRNQIAPDALPYKTPADQIYDSGDFSAFDGSGAARRRLGRLCRPQGR